MEISQFSGRYFIGQVAHKLLTMLSHFHRGLAQKYPGSLARERWAEFLPQQHEICNLFLHP